VEFQNTTTYHKDFEFQSGDLHFSNPISVSIENDLTSEWNEINHKRIGIKVYL